MNIRDKVLLVEDERTIRSFMQAILTANGYDVLMAGTGAMANTMIASHCPDIIILDLGLPDMDGMDVLTQLRAWSLMPVVVVSARTDEREKVRALDAGADDYITKPFSVRELAARVKSLLRRVAPQQESEPQTLRAGDIMIDITNYEAFKGGEKLSLTLKEFELLKVLVLSRGKVLIRDFLLDRIWGYEYYGETRTVDVHIKRLREKVEGVSDQWALKTVWGVGYKFEVRQ